MNGTTPHVQLRAKATKSRRADTLPLRQDIAEELAQLRGGAVDGERVFASVPTMDEHRAYLAQAKIPWEDGQGRRADFHAMRHTYGTMLSTAGVSPREAMELMRHSDLKLTVHRPPSARIIKGGREAAPALGPRRPSERRRRYEEEGGK